MKALLYCLLLCFMPTRAQANITLPAILRDSMILQRNATVNVWGWADIGEKITVQFAGRTYRTTTNNNGKWLVKLAPVSGGPFTMTIKGGNQVILHNILMGDVWFCSGQSNMVHQMALHSVRYAGDITEAHYPEIRQFWVPNTTNLQAPQNNVSPGYWKWANPADVGEFSAVAYFFARKLYQQYHVPIGIINASWGGSPIEAWMSEDALKPFSAIEKTLQKNKDTAYVNSTNRAAAASNQTQQYDKGLLAPVKWYDTNFVAKGWRTISVPGYWEDQGIKDLDGVVWYRREIDIPVDMIGQPAKVFLGRIVDADALYINGKLVGSTSYMYPQRRYTLPAGTLVPGKNLFVVRVTNNSGKGGFVPDKPYQIIAGDDTIDLTGYWQYKVGQVNQPRTGPLPVSSIALQNQPAALYNAMVAPFLNYTIKGFVWYQGESNTGRPDEYAQLQPAMIADWRNKWNQPGAPFLYVQLPGFMDMNYLPAESQWAAFRQAQLQTLSVPNTAMAVAIDLGEWNDIHPDRKKEVGERLALAAKKLAYGDSLVYSGPLLQSAKAEGHKVRLVFNHNGSGLITNDGEEPAGFAIAGADRKFVWAQATIQGNNIIVWNNQVTNPKYVRYAWADNPVNPNLYNKEGLPASPFGVEVK